jgi:hypothetical protein
LLAEEVALLLDWAADTEVRGERVRVSGLPTSGLTSCGLRLARPSGCQPTTHQAEVCRQVIDAMCGLVCGQQVRGARFLPSLAAGCAEH